MAREASQGTGSIQASTPFDASWSVEKIQHAALEKHLPLIEEAGKKGVQILGLQEIFNGPYFCPSQDPRWYDAAEPVPGPTTEMMQALAKKHQMAMVVPVYEREQAGVYYNTAAVIDADGTLPRQVPEDPHPAHQRLLGEVLLQARQPRLPGLPDALRARSASTSATTGTSRRARARSASTAPRSCSTRRPRSRASRSTSGSSSSRRTRSPTATSSPRATASAPRRPGTSASSTARATSSTRAATSSRRRARTRTSWSSATCDLDAHRGGAPHLAVLPRPPPRDVR